MTDEAVPVEGPYEVHDFDVTANTIIPKGTLCKLSGDRLAGLSSGADVFAGVAMTEKSTADGDVSTSLGLATTGTFDMHNASLNTAITLGGLVSLSGVNVVKQATEAEVVTGAAFGKAIEGIAANGAGEVKLILT